MNRNRPNIIMFLSDQQRWDTLGCYGQKLNVSPYLDQLAEQGVLFSQAYTCQPVCGPARATLQTGRYPTEIGCFRNNIALPSDVKTLANYLDEAGYDLGYIGKWHLASDGGLETSNLQEKNYHNRGIPVALRGGYKGYWKASDILEFTSHGYDGHIFDENCDRVDFQGYRADAITDFALDYLDDQTTNKPFFMFLSHIEPHHQNDHHHYEGPKGSKERFKNFDVPSDLQGLEGDYQEEFADYLGCCNRLDANVGRVIGKLKSRGLYENTILIYTSDHGSHFRTRNRNLDPGNYDDYKRSCHDGCTHIPLIIHGPGFDQGIRINSLVSLVDIPKTILAMAGIGVGNDMQGYNLTDLVSGEKDKLRDEVFMQISESRVGRAIRTEKWKYAVVAPGLSGGTHSCSSVYQEEFLYDLEADPAEHCNLVDHLDYQAERTMLAERLIRQMVIANESIPIILPKNERESTL